MDNSTLIPSFGYRSVIQGFTAVILLISLVVPFRSSQALPNPPSITFTVNTDSDLSDSNPGDGACDTSTGFCSLRAAVEELNAYAPFIGGMINFMGDYTINLGSYIHLLANSATITGNGHTVTIIGPSTNSTIALWLSGGGGQIDHLTIKNPPDPDVPFDQGGYGIYIAPSGSHPGSNYLIDHVTFLSSYDGVMIYGGSTNTIQYSLFGTTQASPTSCVESERNRYGIYLSSFAYATLIQNNQIVCGKEYGSSIMDVQSNGTTILANTIAGNIGIGIDIYGSNGTTIIQNFIGNQGGTTEFPNGFDGIRVEGSSTNVTIGGSGITDGNIISGNSQFGILIQDTTNVLVDRNLIGLDVNHDPLPNYFGVAVSSASHVTIGSNNHALYQQFISSNRYGGVSIGSSDDITILDNTLIGLASWTSDVAPDDPAGNGWDGISINDSTNVTVESWKIAYNEWSGIYVQGDSSLHNTFLPKNIYSNGRLPIDLEPYGFTTNDAGDADSGPNDLLNYPVITSASDNEINGTACANCTIYFYRVSSNPGLNGGGASYDLGMAPAVADGSGNWSATLPYGIRPWNISMLTYDSESNQTSEFSPIYTTFIPLTIRP